MQRRFKVGEVEIIHFYMPGKFLNDISLKKLHSSLIQINDDCKAINVIPFLDKNLTIEEIREHLENTVIAFGMINKKPYGFLVHPVINEKKEYSIETDLFVVSKNPGLNFNKIMAYGNLMMLYKKIGTFHSAGVFDLDVGNVGRVNWFKNLLITFKFHILKKELLKIASDRDVECETIRQIISNMSSSTGKKCLRY